MKDLGIDDFDKYFFELHEKKPYSWQKRLAQRAVQGNWPGAIDLPTGAGKTACIDITVFALACQMSATVERRTAPVRVFFCVNRRVIVDEAYRRSKEIAEKIWQAERDERQETPILRQVAAALRALAGTSPDCDVPPLDVLELRGGIFRDNRWARSPTQPTIVCTTIDQLGSRLLFRGYGVSPNAAPIPAALIAYDSLILLDEAHISNPFLETLANVRRYTDPEKWAEQSIGVPPLVVVPMTATPPAGVDRDAVISLDDADRDNESLDNRLRASKPARLVTVTDVTSSILTEAKRLVTGEPKAVGVIVNRVAAAREVCDGLRKQHPDSVVELVIGSMRPIDRDEQSERLRRIVGPTPRPDTAQTSFVVATQCLEVGADYDFDVLITECASLDALRQRFGRLNRGGRPIEAEALIVMQKKAVKAEAKLKDDNREDPIYGKALARTWNWLTAHAKEEVVDFGIDAFGALLGDEPIPRELLAPSALLDSPVMLPAYIDLWCQTSPAPALDPDISLFLHGREQSSTDVQVCWRSDLVATDEMKPNRDWCDVVALLPPTSAECMTVPISRVRQWLLHAKPESDEGDLLGALANNDDDSGPPKPTLLRHGGVLWRAANKSKFLESANELRPGDTLVLPELAGGWDELGHIPSLGQNGKEDTESRNVDVAEPAFEAARDRVVLRVHPSLHLPSALSSMASLDQDEERPVWREALKTACQALPDNESHARETVRCLLEGGFTYELYPDRQGVVFFARQRLRTSRTWFHPLDDGDDSMSRMVRRERVPLTAHTSHVLEVLNDLLTTLPLSDVAKPLRQAGTLHDHGKADDRFQAMLKREARTEAWLRTGRSMTLLAKSDAVPETPRDRKAARQRAQLPDGFRHEMLSVQMAQKARDLPKAPLLRDLTLHLIAAHHGYARPLAPAVVDEAPPDVQVDDLVVNSDERLTGPPHRIDLGIPDRFWLLTRHFGWWGLAYLECVLRLADQQASSAEDTGELDNGTNHTMREATV